MSSGADLSTILDRILDTAADNLRVAKILVQLGLDPDNITYDALFNRLLEIVLRLIQIVLGYDRFFLLHLQPERLDFAEFVVLGMVLRHRRRRQQNR